MDNVVFSTTTVWANHMETYNFFPGKSGKTIIHDGVDINSVESGTYDFVFASHCLEHIANPLRALREWSRVVKPGGHVILILPERSMCFDHKRNISSFSTLHSQYERKVGEDDLSTLPEILRNHDLSMDTPAGTFEQFTRRSLDNYNNRCLHHYVYSSALLSEMTAFLGYKDVHTESRGLNLWFIFRT
jgi:ubiquinone/menaquinone biosynthesis C-methylase UbiE